MTSTNELRVFISSTLIREARGRDLQEEREHLIKKIFPEIRSLGSDAAGGRVLGASQPDQPKRNRCRRFATTLAHARDSPL